jgi:ATP-dependent Clp protease ATP-binding subunit ClpA
MRTCLSAAFLAINCAEMTSTTDLFGSAAPSPGYEQGSALNNFLCRNHGQRCIVFLDEFEKMGPAVHESLLTPFDEGLDISRLGQ